MLEIFFKDEFRENSYLKIWLKTASTIVGGSAGWAAGAVAGAALGSVVPIIGTAAGGLIGGLVGSFGGGALASEASSCVLDEFIEDDANKMIKIIQEVFTKLAKDYLISEKEAKKIVDQLADKLTGSLLKDMYASDNRQTFANNLLIDYFEKTSKTRSHIKLPNAEQMKKSLRMYLEDIA